MASAYQMMSLLAAATLLLAVQVGAVPAANEDDCDYAIVESMPDGMSLPKLNQTSVIPTHKSLMDMVDSAQRTLRIATFYLMLTPEENFKDHPSTLPGQMLLDSIVGAARRGIDVEILIDSSNRRAMSSPEDISTLKEAGVSIKRLNMRKLLGAGVMHSKFLIADNATLYIGSSNFDWRSYTQIKEIGIAYKNCPTLALDLDRIYRTYALMTRAQAIPDAMSKDLWAKTNLAYPLEVDDFKVFLAGAPPDFNHGTGRTGDIIGLLHIIEGAKKSIDISVMNYSPQFEFAKVKEYWPIIDTALRRAATERKIRVRLLFSKWANSKPMESVWYKSLNALNTPLLKKAGIHVKLFEIPAFDEFQKSIPYARVKHDKFMVTDSGLYIGTSNWAPDYFTNTCGVGVVMESDVPNGAAKIVQSMQELFERDFESEYAHELE